MNHERRTLNAAHSHVTYFWSGNQSFALCIFLSVSVSQLLAWKMLQMHFNQTNSIANVGLLFKMLWTQTTMQQRLMFIQASYSVLREEMNKVISKLLFISHQTELLSWTIANRTPIIISPITKISWIVIQWINHFPWTTFRNKNLINQLSLELLKAKRIHRQRPEQPERKWNFDWRSFI